MKAPFDFVIEPKGNRYNNTTKVGDKNLILNTEIYNHQFVNREAIVKSIPTAFETEIKPGDTIITHHNVFRRWHGNRTFAIAPTAMSAAGNPPWHRSRIERARDVLREIGLLEELKSPTKSKRKSGLYRLNLPKWLGERVYSDCCRIPASPEVAR